MTNQKYPKKKQATVPTKIELPTQSRKFLEAYCTDKNISLKQGITESLKLLQKNSEYKGEGENESK
ncbi:MAG: hypothetical protein RR313_05665 [Anaerovoracaceae bacterium]